MPPLIEVERKGFGGAVVCIILLTIGLAKIFSDFPIFLLCSGASVILLWQSREARNRVIVN